MSDLLRPLKDLRYRLFYGALISRKFPVVELGSRATGCQWRLHPGGLGRDSIVYSGGVGRDISFEHDLVKRFGCNIVLFDPSPSGLETMALTENRIPQFKHHPVALADHCGTLKFAPPKDDRDGSWYLAGGTDATIEVPCTDLPSLMARNGHDHIDLLKMDIEGAEYGVLDDILQRRIPVRQILVEFHHLMGTGIKRSQTVRAIWNMVTGGYHLLDQDGSNHTFLRRKS